MCKVLGKVRDQRVETNRPSPAMSGPLRTRSMAVVEAHPSSHSGEDCNKLSSTHCINCHRTGILGTVSGRDELIHPGCDCGECRHGSITSGLKHQPYILARHGQLKTRGEVASCHVRSASCHHRV